MGNHDPITVGKDLDKAFMFMEMIEHSAKVAYLIHEYNKK